MRHSKEAVDLAFTVLQQTIEQLSRDPGSMVIARSDELHEINGKLESENAELREKLAEANTERNEAKRLRDIYRGDCDNYYAETKELRENLVAANKINERNADAILGLEAKFARLKSSSQWAVTCNKMTADEAKQMAKKLIQYRQGGPSQCCYAVPLAPEDGPWVLCRREAVGVFYRPYGSGGTGSLETAYKYETREAAERDCGSRYVPVRLSDVADKCA